MRTLDGIYRQGKRDNKINFIQKKAADVLLFSAENTRAQKCVFDLYFGCIDCLVCWHNRCAKCLVYGVTFQNFGII